MQTIMYYLNNSFPVDSRPKHEKCSVLLRDATILFRGFFSFRQSPQRVKRAKDVSSHLNSAMLCSSQSHLHLISISSPSHLHLISISSQSHLSSPRLTLLYSSQFSYAQLSTSHLMSWDVILGYGRSFTVEPVHFPAIPDRKYKKKNSTGNSEPSTQPLPPALVKQKRFFKNFV